MINVWFSAGDNLVGFDEKDFPASNNSALGP
jgi:hypothetical protein